MKSLQVASAVERHTGTDGSFETAVDGLGLYRASRKTEHDATVYEPSLCVVAQGAKEVLVGGEAYRYDPSQFLLVSVDLPAISRVIEASPKRPCLAIRITLDVAAVGDLLTDTEMSPPRVAGRGLGVAPIGPLLLDAVERLMTLLHSPRDIRALAPLIKREITYRVLMSPQGSRLRQMAFAGGSAFRVFQAVRWIKGHFTEPMSIDSLAAHVGLSTSSLHEHFKRVTTISPLQYQKQLRLQEARRLLLGEMDAADAAYRVGYESPSQFSREYRRLFGAPPRKDIAAVKANFGS